MEVEFVEKWRQKRAACFVFRKGVGGTKFGLQRGSDYVWTKGTRSAIDAQVIMGNVS